MPKTCIMWLIKGKLVKSIWQVRRNGFKVKVKGQGTSRYPMDFTKTCIGGLEKMSFFIVVPPSTTSEVCILTLCGQR
jgi:hypothetical protein